MKKILNHQNKENVNHQNHPNTCRLAHPSHQSKQRPFKPTIKVGYKIIESKQQEPRPYKKPIIVSKPTVAQRQGLKKVMSTLSQAQSGRFIEEEYVVQHSAKPKARFQRKGVEQAHEKYHSGRQFSQELRSQFVSKNRQSRSITQRSSIATERSKLSGYKNQGIKDIMQYHYAGSYRESKLPNKCSQEKVKDRNLRFSDIHDLDFRRLKAFP